jgi:hypothetical protein
MSIEAMKLALEAFTKFNASPHLEDCEGAFDYEIAALRQAIEQAQQVEPVAFASHGVVNWIADKQFQHEADLYTSPQRQWVGLTDEEVEKIIKANMSLQMNLAGIRADFEAAYGIKEKNHD